MAMGDGDESILMFLRICVFTTVIIHIIPCSQYHNNMVHTLRLKEQGHMELRNLTKATKVAGCGIRIVSEGNG